MSAFSSKALDLQVKAMSNLLNLLLPLQLHVQGGSRLKSHGGLVGRGWLSCLQGQKWAQSILVGG